MSRSRKKYPIIRQETVDKAASNRKVRHEKMMELKGSEYKKLGVDWNAKYMWTREDAIRNYKPSKYFPTLESWLQYYERCCVRK